MPAVLSRMIPKNDWSGGSRTRSVASGRRNSRPVCVLAPASAGSRILASVSETSGTSRKPSPESLNPNMVKLFETPDQDADRVIGRVIPVSATRRNSIDQSPAAIRTVPVDKRSDWLLGRSRTGSMRRAFRATCERWAGDGLIERSMCKRAGHIFWGDRMKKWGNRRSGCRSDRIEPADGRARGGRRVRGGEGGLGKWRRGADRRIRNLRHQEPSGPHGAQPADRREPVDRGFDRAGLQAGQGAQGCRERKLTTRASQKRRSRTDEDGEDREVEIKHFRDDDGRHRLLLTVTTEIVVRCEEDSTPIRVLTC